MQAPVSYGKSAVSVLYRQRIKLSAAWCSAGGGGAPFQDPAAPRAGSHLAGLVHANADE